MIFYISKHLAFNSKERNGLTLVACFLLLSLAGCSNEVEVTKEPARTVRVATIIASDSVLQRRFTGRVDAISTVELSFQVPGKLIKLSATEGTLIPKGGVIAELDKSDYRLAKEQAEAQYSLAKLDLTRKQNLLKSGSLPKVMLDQAETHFKLSRVALETAKRNLSYTKIIAPFDALVSKRLIDNYANVAAQRPIVRVQELTELRVSINIPENMVAMLENSADLKAEAVFKGRPKQRFPLIYREHMTEAGSVAQTYEVIFGLSREKNKHVLPGMTVGVIISKQRTDAAQSITVPITALDYDTKGAPRVWIFNPQTKTVEPRNVTLGSIRKRQIPVLTGLKSGEQIVTAGAHLLRKGMSVRRFVSF